VSADAGNVKVECFSFFEEWNQFIELRAGVGTGTGVARISRLVGKEQSGRGEG
jgi:hypothetical protein